MARLAGLRSHVCSRKLQREESEGVFQGFAAPVTSTPLSVAA
jgi:hypothetical protein